LGLGAAHRRLLFLPGSKLHGLAPIVDPNDEIIEVPLAALRWNMQQRRFGLTAVGLDKLHALSEELLDLLKENMSYRTGGAEGWNFEKAHSILHKVRDILLFGWSENSATRALSMATLITARNWPVAPTTRMYISRDFGHMPARVTCSTSGRWRQIWLTLSKTRVMTLGNLFLPLLSIRRVKLVLASWGSDTRHCNQYTLEN
jgi:hypothetical protein